MCNVIPVKAQVKNYPQVVEIRKAKMRDYKFRGMTKEGKWVYGYYVVEGYKKPKPHFIVEPGGQWHIVLPETVGQFTGLHDDKRTKEYPEGQEIYEGDIIQNIEHKNLWIIVWDIQYAKFGFQYTNGILIDERATLGGEILFEVIGNAHENKELLEETKE